MQYVKKMCILRQVRQGFSGDGKTLSGLIKIEQYGKNLAVEVSVINFAPLALGEYYCLLSDGKGKTEMLCLRGKSLFNLLSDLDISSGFCGIVCYVKNDVVPIAYGVNGNGSYDWRSILNATLPPVFPLSSRENAAADSSSYEPPCKVTSEVLSDGLSEPVQPPASSTFTQSPQNTDYNDERVATENYYEEEHKKETADEQLGVSETIENARIEGATEKQTAKTGADETENGDADRVLHPFKTDSDGYYTAVKTELEALFKTYPRDKTLNGAFSCSEWVRVKGTAKQPQYLVGVLYDDGKAKYICYALAAEDRENPPEEIKNVCAFIPCSPLKENEGFFVIFQSAATGECIPPARA